MPIRIIQSNDRIAEVQYICDNCGKPIQTRLIPKQEADELIAKKFICYQCKQQNKP